MIADGAWKRNNVTNYITCDDYDGKNKPKRRGLNIKKYFNKVNLWPTQLFPLVSFYDLGNNGESNVWSNYDSIKRT